MKIAEQLEQEQTGWEALCRRCGLCCFEKDIDSKGRIIATAVPCRHLDIHSRLCRVYQNRQSVEHDCIKLSPENISELSWLPEGCAYRDHPSAKVKS